MGAFRRLRTLDVSAGGANLVLAVGADAWPAVAPEMAPTDLAPFVPVRRSDGRHTPATQHDAGCAYHFAPSLNALNGLAGPE